MKTIAQQIKWDFEANGRLEILDKNGDKIYFEGSTGKIIDLRLKPCENKVVEIDGVKFKLVKV